MSDSLRPLLASDLDEVAVLERALFGVSAWSAAMVAEELGAPGRWYVALEVPGVQDAPQVVGYAGLWFDGDVAQVMTIGVAPHAQGAGRGARLLEALIEHARELGATAVLLEVRVDNDAALGLYRRRGFEVLGRRRRYYQPEDVDAFTMRLVLA